MSRTFCYAWAGLRPPYTEKLVNADANGALNILRKHLNLSKAKENQFLQRLSGCLIQPFRIDLKNLPLYES